MCLCLCLCMLQSCETRRTSTAIDWRRRRRRFRRHRGRSAAATATTDMLNAIRPQKRTQPHRKTHMHTRKRSIRSDYFGPAQKANANVHVLNHPTDERVKICVRMQIRGKNRATAIIAGPAIVTMTNICLTDCWLSGSAKPKSIDVELLGGC